MNEARLSELLRSAPIADEPGAEERGLRIVVGEFKRRSPAVRPRLRPRLAIVLAVAAILLALILSPAGAEVRDWIGDVIDPGVERAEPALTRLPGGGDLLVQSPQGPWLVHANGSRRLLGDYDEATWSPRGLFVAAAGGRQLTAVEPDGDPHWSISRPARITSPRWAPSGYRVAYLSGQSLRVVAGDGTGDRLLLPRVADIPPAWRPGPDNVLAVAKTPSDVRIIDVDSGRQLGAYRTSYPITSLQWSESGNRLMLASDRSVTLVDRRLRLELLWDSAAIERVGVAAFVPDRAAFAVIVHRRGASPRSEVLVVDESAEGSRARSVFAGPGTFTSLAPSPDGRHLLVAWRDADQWLFIPVAGRGRVTAVDEISHQFSPGAEHPAFPRVGVSDWCCPR
jgi:hypothetical protein